MALSPQQVLLASQCHAVQLWPASFRPLWFMIPQQISTPSSRPVPSPIRSETQPWGRGRASQSFLGTPSPVLGTQLVPTFVIPVFIRAGISKPCPLPVFINKVLLAHTTHSFTHHLWLLLPYKDRVEQLRQRLLLLLFNH